MKQVVVMGVAALAILASQAAFAQQMDPNMQSSGQSGKNYDENSNSRNPPQQNGATKSAGEAAATEAARPASPPPAGK